MMSEGDGLRAVREALDHWKRELLDLSRRNKLLYFHTARGIRIPITSPLLTDLYRRLILDEKPLKFPQPLDETIEDAEVSEERADGVPQRVRQGDLEVPFDGRNVKDIRDLQRRLYRLRTDARSMIAEQAINTLHLAFGFLEWRDASYSDEIVRSPLILAPVALERDKDSPYRLEPYDDDVVLNPTLVYKLRSNFGLELPSLDPYDGFGEEPNLPEFFRQVARAVESRGWRVVPEVWLAHFSFQKLVMYTDLRSAGTVEEAAEHPVLGAVTGISVPSEVSVSALGDIDAAFDAPEIFPVVDADSSQMEVLARVGAGESLVVQGPPGTGKSQTIVNLIGQALRQAKTVLFVSQKRAALDVVYRRLEQAGLAPLCLEMHSHQASKRQVVKELHEALDPSPETGSYQPHRFEERGRARRQLRAYVEELHKVRDDRGRTPFMMHGALARLSHAPSVTADLPIPSARELEAEREAEYLHALLTLANSGVWDVEASHPWRDSEPEGPAITLVERLRPTLERIRQALDHLGGLVRSIRDELGLPLEAPRPEDLGGIVSILHRLASPPYEVPGSWLRVALPALYNHQLSLRECLDRQRQARDAQRRLGAIGATPLLEAPSPVHELLARFRGTHSGPLRWIQRVYWADRRRVSALSGRKLSHKEALASLEGAETYLQQRDWFESQAPRLVEIVGPRYRGLDTDFEAFSQTLSWTIEFRSLFPDGEMPSLLIGHLKADQAATATRAGELETGLSRELARLTDGVSVLQQLFPRGVKGKALGGLTLEELRAHDDQWTLHLDDLADWATYKSSLRRGEDMGLGPFLVACREAGVVAVALEEAFRRKLATQWLVETYAESQVLAGFNPNGHEQLMAAFRKLDRDLERLSSALARHLARRRIPSPPPINERMLLRKEYHKKKRHVPLRRLLPAIPTLLTALKPCLLMSPLSVASYLPRGSYMFDLVIFDEASQVTPADAVGSILRGRQLAVMGDDRQLPPTNFFNVILEEEEPPEDLEDPDLPAFESILEVCSTKLPSNTLRWHYRSKDERLIAYSNRAFYEAKLVTFPSPSMDSETGVRFVYVEDGVYGRGGTRTNLPEARRLVELIFDHFEKYPERSLGVIALSVAQRDAIDLELRRARTLRADLEPLFAEHREEPFFIKNLEAVQGDERDEVILSLGYGPTEPGGDPPMSFGPLNHKGGERRLNVAITRARFRSTIVSSIRPEQFDAVHRSKWEGPRRLAEYVQYAARGGEWATEAIGDVALPDSDFEIAVYEALLARGFQVAMQVGSSGFRIDLAVRHPDIPSRYILGIECDGAAYHSAKTVRDRDRLRQQILESLGWNIHRVWSTDWVRHPDKAVDRIVERIEALRTSGDLGVRRATRDPSHPENGTQSEPPPAPQTGRDEDDPPWERPSGQPRTTIFPSEIEDFTEHLALVPYQVYESRRRPRHGVLEASLSEITEHLRGVVQTEGPVHRDAAFQRVSSIYGHRRMGSRIVQVLEQALRRAVARKLITVRAGFLWKPDHDGVVARGPSQNGDVRPAKHIPVEEIEVAAVELLSKLGATEPGKLETHVARALGFRRSGKDVGTLVRKAIGRALKAGEIIEAHGYLKCAS